MASLRFPAVYSMAVLFSLSALAAIRSAEDTPVAVEVLTVTTSGYSGAPVVILKEKEGTRALPIVIGSFEATAILQELSGRKSPRPLTHDLLKNVLDGTGVVLESVVVTQMNRDVFFAVINLKRDGREIAIDSRPSDAIALALRCKKPVLVSKSLMNSKASFDLSENAGPLHFGGLTLQSLTPELAARLGTGSVKGVVVADLRGPRYEGRLARGDVIVSFEGRKVSSLVEAAVMLREVADGRAFSLEIVRGGRRIKIRIPAEGKNK